MASRILLVVALSLAMVYTAHAAECGRQAADAVCLFGACCSKDGMCGRGDDFCGDGCQQDASSTKCNKAQEAAPASQCGPSAGGKKCRTWARRGQECCSSDGRCGLTMEFCGLGCQREFGACFDYSQLNLE